MKQRRSLRPLAQKRVGRVLLQGEEEVEVEDVVVEEEEQTFLLKVYVAPHAQTKACESLKQDQYLSCQ